MKLAVECLVNDTRTVRVHAIVGVVKRLEDELKVLVSILLMISGKVASRLVLC
jgi:hypothetical protein